MTLSWFDHIFFGLIVVVFPVWDFFFLRREKERIDAGETGRRMALYRRAIAEEWGELVILLGAWFVLGRGSVDLGLGLGGGTVAWIGYGLGAASCLALVVQAHVVIRSPENRATVRDQLDRLSFLMPETLRERRTFDALSVTAGVCEEVLYRGFVIAYLVALLPISFWLAAVLSAVIFGLAHAYQGPGGAAKAGVVGLVMAVLFGLTGSLWAPILVHCLMDATSGHIAYAAAQDDPPPRASACPAA